MQRTCILILLATVITGCSSTRKATETVTERENIREIYVNDITVNNITNSDFHISRADIEINDKNGKSFVMASLKYRKDGTYLLSVRTRSGIEMLRLYFTTDTLMANDRIKRRFYTASNAYLQKKYGISFSLIPLIFGDIVSSSEANQIIKCSGRVNIDRVKQNEIKYIAECGYGKIRKAEIEGSTGAGKIVMEYAEYVRDNEYVYPSRIRMKDKDETTVINFDIRRIAFEGTGLIKFVPGANYERVILK